MDTPTTLLARIEERLLRIESALSAVNAHDVTSQDASTERTAHMHRRPVEADPPPTLLPVRAVAARWAVTDRRIRDLIASGRIRTIRVGRRGLRIALTEVERFERTGGR